MIVWVVGESLAEVDVEDSLGERSTGVVWDFCAVFDTEEAARLLALGREQEKYPNGDGDHFFIGPATLNEPLPWSDERPRWPGAYHPAERVAVQ